MTENEALRSVRVEVEAHSGEPVDSPSAPTRARTSNLGIVAGVLGLGLAGVLMILSLRPDGPGSPDAGTAVPTSTTAVDLLEDDRVTTTSAASTGLFEQTVGAGEMQSIVRAPEGFLGLASNHPDEDFPRIVRSVDGVQWVTVDVAVDDSIPAGLPARTARVFEQLLRTETGYALLMTTSEFESEGDRPPTTIRVQRLTSPEGASWSVDPDFMPLDATGPFTRVLSHGVDSFVILTWPPSPVNNALRELLDANVDGGSSFEEACSVELFGDGQLMVLPCLEGEGLQIDATSMIEPDRFADMAECAGFLSEGSTGEASFWVVNRGHEAAELTGANSLLLLPTVAPDGRVVALDFGVSPRFDGSVCDGLLGVDDLPPPAVVIWETEDSEEPVRFPIPDEISLVDLLSVRAEPAIIGQNMLVLIGSVVTSIDIESGEWAEVLTLPVRPDDEASARITTDGSRLIYLDSARVNVLHLGTGLSTFVESTGGNRPGFPSIIYADNEVVFATGASSTFKIELPAS
jgi:hypothetical protein